MVVVVVGGSKLTDASMLGAKVYSSLPIFKILGAEVDPPPRSVPFSI